MSDDRLCTCGHTAHWHAPDGTCEMVADCDCREFREPEAATTTVPIPEGTRFYQLSAFAETLEAYDALTEQEGWTESIRYNPETGRPTGWKTRPLGKGNVTVYAPHEQP